MVRLSNAGYRKLRGFWANLSCADTDVNWELAEPEELLFTDSSGFGYGAHLSSLTHRSLLTGYWDSTVAV